MREATTLAGEGTGNDRIDLRDSPSTERFSLLSNLTDQLDDVLARCRALTDDAEDSDRRFREQMADSPAAWFRDLERLIAGAQDLARELAEVGIGTGEQTESAAPERLVLPESESTGSFAQPRDPDNELDDGWDEAERAERRYQTLVEQIPAIVYTQDAEEGVSDFLYVSPAIESILGFTPDEWRNSDQWSGQLHPDDRERVWEEASEASARGEPYVSEYRILAKDGRVVWVRDQAVLVRDNEGRPQFWHGVMQEVTDHHVAEDALRHAERRYRDLVERLPAVTYLSDVDGEGNDIYISPQVTSIFGHEPEQWLEPTSKWIKLVHPDDRERVLEDNRRADGATVFSCEYRIMHPDGRAIWAHDEAVLVRDEHGEPLYWQGVVVDISERHRAESLEQELDVQRAASQRLVALDEMKNTFLTAVSHDLRTPLAAILGLALTLNNDDIDFTPQEMGDLLSRIVSNARKLDHLVSDLLDLDRLSRGILELSRHPVDLGALVHGVVDESGLMSERPIAVEADTVIVTVDAAKVERIVENLIANAIRHTPDGSQIWVKVRKEGDAALLIVEDQGAGIPENLRNAVFEPFRQIGPSEASPGVGIGLSLVGRFAELHGGRAWVIDRQGGGASFRVLLPPTGPDESPAPAPAQAPPPTETPP